MFRIKTRSLTLFAILLLGILLAPALILAQDELPLNIHANAITGSPGGRASMLLLAVVYVAAVYATQYVSWHGAWSLYEQHAFLLPAAFPGG